MHVTLVMGFSHSHNRTSADYGYNSSSRLQQITCVVTSVCDNVLTLVFWDCSVSQTICAIIIS
jgi:hypothetical protein